MEKKTKKNVTRFLAGGGQPFIFFVKKQKQLINETIKIK